MKKTILLLISITFVLFWSCEGGDKKSPSKDKIANETGKAISNSKLGEQLKDAKSTLDGLAKDGKGISTEEYEKYMLKLADCTLTDNGIDRKCEAYKTFNKARKNRNTMIKNWGGFLSKLGHKYIKHESPAVRYQAVKLTSSFFGSSTKTQEIIIEAAKDEKEPTILRAMARSVGSKIKNPAVKDLLMKLSKHDNERVRMEALGWMGTSFANDTKGTLERLMEAVDKDSSMKVRVYACQRLGRRADDRAMKTFNKYLGDPKRKDTLYNGCFKGLITMWSYAVPHKKPSHKAYQLTIKLLNRKPRSEKQPPWAVISYVDWAKKPAFQQRAKWFKKKTLIKALMSVAKDRKANWMARTAAVRSMEKLGAAKDKFKALQKAYANMKAGVDSHVLKEINKHL
ncbi:MAG: hypothetical protein IEMM0008_1574 [bacterium]|nr:MAG: hypothetical protein IEMM0008_1574 [bacterium]